jgi:osmotically-inducible protein OsmY
MSWRKGDATAVALLVAVALTAGCQTTPAQTSGSWLSDKTITAKVKTALVQSNVEALTKVDVDTVDGTVYLTGVVDNEARKTEAENIARATEGVRQVVNNLSTASGATSREPSALRSEDTR